ncbi:flavodoxin family protein [Vallitalea sp.]|jgi:multimeric flavodoxin WrbA|uniref:flavodoxin family protein n=1 Tax=Vallitalea sp. TaxID=1882829 RepID=UPI0025D614C9|nr:flavodoxin family protein [Vallitalea sp.]MCT4688938.1 flavodoxin family protein [Vallitalea sp.]
MNKKVLAINSSKRKRNTYGLLIDIKDQLKKINIEVEIINLHDYNIEICTGCESCILKDKCFLDDDMDMLMNKLQQYDGIILSTPIYLNNISGKLKIFIDRTCRWVHRPAITGIPIMNVVTTSFSGIYNTLKYMDNVAIQWGAFPTDNISRKVTTIEDKVQPKEYKNFVKHIMMDKKLYKPSIQQLIYFSVSKVLAQKVIKRDSKYWEEKDWLSKKYFYDAKINIFKKIIANKFYRMIYKKVKL